MQDYITSNDPTSSTGDNNNNNMTDLLLLSSQESQESQSQMLLWSDVPMIRKWELNENSTRYERIIAAPNDDVRVLIWFGWFIVSMIASIIMSMIFLSIVSTKKTRSNPFNQYLLFLMIPDIFMAICCGFGCLLNGLSRTFINEVSCQFQSFYVIFGMTANAWLNGVTCYQLYIMLLTTKQCIPYNPPKSSTVIQHAIIVYIWSIFVASWGLFDQQQEDKDGGSGWWPHHTVVVQGMACLPMNYDLKSTIFWYVIFLPSVMGIPMIYTIYVTYQIYNYQLLPQTGTRRLLSIYFLRLAAVFFIMWFPGIGVLFILGPYVGHWALWIGGFFTHMQGVVSVAVSLLKPDVYTAVTEFWMCHRNSSSSSSTTSCCSTCLTAVLPYYSGGHHVEEEHNILHSNSNRATNGVDDDNDDDGIIYGKKKNGRNCRKKNGTGTFRFLQVLVANQSPVRVGDDDLQSSTRGGGGGGDAIVDYEIGTSNKPLSVSSPNPNNNNVVVVSAMASSLSQHSSGGNGIQPRGATAADDAAAACSALTSVSKTESDSGDKTSTEAGSSIKDDSSSSPNPSNDGREVTDQQEEAGEVRMVGGGDDALLTPRTLEQLQEQVCDQATMEATTRRNKDDQEEGDGMSNHDDVIVVNSSLVPIQQVLENALNMVRESIVEEEQEDSISGGGGGNSRNSQLSRLSALETVSEALTTARDMVVSRNNSTRQQEQHQERSSSTIVNNNRPTPPNNNSSRPATTIGAFQFPAITTPIITTRAPIVGMGGGCHAPLPSSQPTMTPPAFAIPNDLLSGLDLLPSLMEGGGGGGGWDNLLRVIDDVLEIVASETESITGSTVDLTRSVRSSSGVSSSASSSSNLVVVETALEETLDVVNNLMGRRQSAAQQQQQQQRHDTTSSSSRIASAARATPRTTPIPSFLEGVNRHVEVSMLSSTILEEEEEEHQDTQNEAEAEEDLTR